MENVTNLLAVTSDIERHRTLTILPSRLLLKCLKTEPTNPALVIGRKLTTSINRGVTEDNRLKTVNTRPVTNILIS